MINPLVKIEIFTEVEEDTEVSEGILQEETSEVENSEEDLEEISEEVVVKGSKMKEDQFNMKEDTRKVGIEKDLKFQVMTKEKLDLIEVEEEVEETEEASLRETITMLLEITIKEEDTIDLEERYITLILSLEEYNLMKEINQENTLQDKIEVAIREKEEDMNTEVEESSEEETKAEVDTVGMTMKI